MATSKSQLLSRKFVLALTVGLLAALFVSAWLGLWTNGLKGPQLVIAVKDVDPGTYLDSKDLKLVTWAHAPIPSQAFKNINSLDGRVSRQKIVAGEPILESKLAPTGAKAGLAATIAPGKRAITVRVNDVVGVAGFALPGSYVDILVSVKQGGSDSYTRTVLKNIKVLAVAQETGVDNVKPKIVNAVTVELTPEEAEKLDLARTIGTLSLTLRNEVDSLVDQSKNGQSSGANDAIRVSGPRESSGVGASGSVEVIRGMRRGN